MTELNLQSLPGTDKSSIVLIDYDNKAQTFAKLSESERADVSPMLQDVSIFVFQGPDPGLAVCKSDYPDGTTIYKLPQSLMNKEITQSADNEIVMFVTALGLQLSSSYYSNKKKVYIVSGGDKRYDSLQLLAKAYFGNGMEVVLLDALHHSMYDILDPNKACAVCKVVSRNGSYLNGHQKVQCKECGAAYCTEQKEEADKHSTRYFIVCKNSGCSYAWPLCSSHLGPEHLKAHESKGEKYCTKCTDVASKVQWLSGQWYVYHMKTVHQLHQCNMCAGDAYFSTSELASHCKEKHIHDMFACPMCPPGAPPVTGKNMPKHMNAVHGVECVCAHKTAQHVQEKKADRREQQAKERQDAYVNFVDQPTPCSKCDQTVPLGQLPEHQRVMHPKELFKCPLCPPSAAGVNGKNMPKHMTDVHVIHV